jgi:hypothetical protein
MRNLILWGILSIWCILFLVVFHHRAAGKELRYTRVAEGNISGLVRAIWHNGLPGYAAIVRGDASEWGRIRPLHWVYQQLPFLGIMIRNGDLWHVDSETPIASRINGDLQTYTIFQMTIVVLSLMLLGYLFWCSTGMPLAVFVFVPFAVSVPSFPENFVVNFCDSVEIGQIFFIAVYLVALKRYFSLKTPSVWQESLAAFALACAYGMKETSVVVSAAWGATAIMFFLLYRPLERSFLHFLLRHFGVHVLVGGTAVFFIRMFRSGSYANQYRLQESFLDMIARAWRFMHLPGYVLVLMFACAIVAVVLLFSLSDKSRTSDDSYVRVTNLLVMLFLLAVGFFAINVPWGAPLRKYALPSHFFSVAALAILLAMSFNVLLRAKLRPAAALWGLGLFPFILLGLRDSRAQVRDFYDQSYQYRQAVPKVAQDIASNMRGENEITEVVLLAGPLYQEGALPFMRTVNRMHQLNIAHNGLVVSSVRAAERNYFRRYPDRSAVDMKMIYSLEQEPAADLFYIIGSHPAATGEQMAAYGYVFENEWWWGEYVARFVRKEIE